MGRRKIEIQPLGDDRNRTVTFVKRKAGLFKKAYELSVLCKVDLAVIIVGNNNKVYEFSSVDTKELMDFYQQQSPHESRSPENYGRYKKRSRLQTQQYSVMDEDVMQDIKLEDGHESDYDSETPEPKRQRKTTPAPMIYTKQPAVTSRFGQLAAQQSHPLQEADVPQHRPVLRVQIPSDAKAPTADPKAITPEDASDGKKESRGEPTAHAPALNTARYSFGRFKSPETRKQVPQLPFPINKSQASSPSSGSMPQLPMNSSMQFFPSLPQPSPSGQYHPSILPTPVFNSVFNQVFSQQYMPNQGQDQNQNPAQNPSGSSHQAPHLQSQMSSGQVPQTQPHLGQEAVSSGPDASMQAPEVEGTAPKPKPPLQLNGDQTPVSGLPSRYMNDIFPSPSNLYASQEWPTGMTPYSQQNMSHYFVNMIPSASGQTPMPMTALYSNASRNSLQRPHGGPSSTELKETITSNEKLRMMENGQAADPPEKMIQEQENPGT